MSVDEMNSWTHLSPLRAPTHAPAGLGPLGGGLDDHHLLPVSSSSIVAFSGEDEHQLHSQHNGNGGSGAAASADTISEWHRTQLGGAAGGPGETVLNPWHAAGPALMPASSSSSSGVAGPGHHHPPGPWRAQTLPPPQQQFGQHLSQQWQSSPQPSMYQYAGAVGLPLQQPPSSELYSSSQQQRGRPRGRPRGRGRGASRGAPSGAARVRGSRGASHRAAGEEDDDDDEDYVEGGSGGYRTSASSRAARAAASAAEFASKLPQAPSPSTGEGTLPSLAGGSYGGVTSAAHGSAALYQPQSHPQQHQQLVMAAGASSGSVLGFAALLGASESALLSADRSGRAYAGGSGRLAAVGASGFPSSSHGYSGGGGLPEAPSCDLGGEMPRKRRFLWTELLHRRFIAAIFDLGVTSSTPKLLSEAMAESCGPDGLTSDHIKSHLQVRALSAGVIVMQRIAQARSIPLSHASSAAEVPSQQPHRPGLVLARLRPGLCRGTGPGGGRDAAHGLGAVPCDLLHVPGGNALGHAGGAPAAPCTHAGAGRATARGWGRQQGPSGGKLCPGPCSARGLPRVRRALGSPIRDRHWLALWAVRPLCRNQRAPSPWGGNGVAW